MKDVSIIMWNLQLWLKLKQMGCGASLHHCCPSNGSHYVTLLLPERASFSGWVRDSSQEPYLNSSDKTTIKKVNFPRSNNLYTDKCLS